MSFDPSVVAVMQRVSVEQGVPLEILEAVGWHESRFQPAAKNPASSATGIMQLLSGTAKQWGVTDSTDPYQNITGGAKYLHYLLARYNGNVQAALTAYAAGEGNYDRGTIPAESTASAAEELRWLASGATTAGGPTFAPIDVGAVTLPAAASPIVAALDALPASVSSLLDLFRGAPAVDSSADTSDGGEPGLTGSPDWGLIGLGALAAVALASALD